MDVRSSLESYWNTFAEADGLPVIAIKVRCSECKEEHTIEKIVPRDISFDEFENVVLEQLHVAESLGTESRLELRRLRLVPLEEDGSHTSTFTLPEGATVH